MPNHVDLRNSDGQPAAQADSKPRTGGQITSFYRSRRSLVERTSKVKRVHSPALRLPDDVLCAVFEHLALADRCGTIRCTPYACMLRSPQPVLLSHFRELSFQASRLFMQRACSTCPRCNAAQVQLRRGVPGVGCGGAPQATGGRSGCRHRYCQAGAVTLLSVFDPSHQANLFHCNQAC